MAETTAVIAAKVAFSAHSYGENINKTLELMAAYHSKYISVRGSRTTGELCPRTN